MRTATTSAHDLLRLIDEGDFTSAARAMVRRGLTLDHLGTDRQRVVRAEIFRDNEGGCSTVYWPAFIRGAIQMRGSADVESVVSWHKLKWLDDHTPYLMWRGVRVETFWQNTRLLRDWLYAELEHVLGLTSLLLWNGESLRRKTASVLETFSKHTLDPTPFGGEDVRDLLNVVEHRLDHAATLITERAFPDRIVAGCLRWLITGEVTS